MFGLVGCFTPSGVPGDTFQFTVTNTGTQTRSPNGPRASVRAGGAGQVGQRDRDGAAFFAEAAPGREGAAVQDDRRGRRAGDAADRPVVQLPFGYLQI